ncbi:MAG: PKD domain-containing protein [Pyrinomonadaceae bacterium]
MPRKSHPSRFASLGLLTKIALAALICAIAIFAAVVAAASSAGSGTLSLNNPTITYTRGPFNQANPTANASLLGVGPGLQCDANFPCDDYTLAIDATGIAYGTKNVRVQIDWANKDADFDLYVDGTNGKKVNDSASSADPEIVTFPVESTSVRVRVVPYNPLGEKYTATISLVDAPPAQTTVPASGSAPRYQNYASPNALGANSGEPSIGANWKTGKVLFQSSVRTLRVGFDDCSSPAKATWEDKSAPTSATTFDPILFTDSKRGRTFVSQLIFGTTLSLSSITDDDGATWIPSQGAGIASGIDHQTYGGGPFAAPLTRDANSPLYPNAVYYCAQDLVTANCAVSLDGGITYGPAISAYTLTCGGLHGHIKVAPDGTAYLPNKGCSGAQGVAVSTDNGVTWTIKTVPNSTPGDSDPSVGIGANGAVYFGYADGDGHPRVAVSHDHGDSWSQPQDVGAAFNIQNTVFPAMVAGDDDRAAYAFLGTSTPNTITDGNFQSLTFKGIWHLYVATTYDGGNSWVTVDATPTDPVQRGGIWLQGGSQPHRNLLDFMDVTVDREGRVLVGYADGCIGAACTDPSTSRSKLGTIARQSGGRRLFAQYDPPEPTAPGAPRVSVTRDGAGVYLSWPEPDNGGSAITGYKVYRGTTSGGETLLASVAAGKDPTPFSDLTTDASTTYFYRVTATNAAGEGAACEVNTTGAPAPANSQTDSCDGLNVITDAAGDAVNPAVDGSAAGSTDQVDITNVSFSTNAAARTLTTTMALKNLSAVPINGTSQTYYYVVWTSSDGKTYATRAVASGTVSYLYGEFDTSGNKFVSGTSKAATGTFNPGANGTVTVTVPLSGVGNPTIPISPTDTTTTPAVSKPYALTISGEGATGTGLVFTQPADRAPDTGFGSRWAVCAASSTPTPTPTPTATPTPVATPTPSSTSDSCTLPGITVVTDPANDQTGAPNANQQQDIRAIQLAEQYPGGSGQLVVTMTVSALDSNTLPPNGNWRTSFNATHADGTTTTYFVSVNTNSSSNPTGTSFNYGFVDTTGANAISRTVGSADGGSLNPANKTLTVVLRLDKLKKPVAATGGATLSGAIVDLSAGKTLTAVNGITSILIGAIGNGLNQTVDSTASGSFTFAGTGVCPVTLPPPPPSGTPQPGPRYQNYAAPNGVGTTAGEPSIGVNWQTGRVFFQSGLQTLRVMFNDCFSPAKTVWEDKSAPTSKQSLDPILFTDHMRASGDNTPNRTIVSQLAGTTSLSSLTDDDGRTWVPNQGGGIASGIDHQTIGAGPYHAPLPANPTYPNAVYYCSQDAVNALCALSTDGGLTYGPAVPIYTSNSCSGLHGHVKVAPDGTVYVPNKSCGSPGRASVVVSKDNGITWTVRTVPNSGTTGYLVDPSVGIGADGTIYLGYQHSDGHARIAVSHDQGATWESDQDVGTQLGINNITFPAVVAGDKDRAAYTFLGTPTPGNYTNESFTGVWHLYIASTFDGGRTWTTVDATPNDPVQRGSICNLGTTSCAQAPAGPRTKPDRNLLDFMDATVDKEGRVLVGYPDGCITGTCINGGANDFTAKAVIARQSGGKRLFAAYDQPDPTVPGSPLATATSDSTGVHLAWSEPDNGGTPITGYRVYRRTDGSTQKTLLADVGTYRNYDDPSADPGANYFYTVTAVNAVGESPLSDCSEVSPAPAADPCKLPGVSLVKDPTGDAVPPEPALDIQEAWIAEPYTAGQPDRLVFTMKVASLSTIPPDHQWYIIWDFGTGLRKYVAAKSDATGALSYEYGHIGAPLSTTSPSPDANRPFPEGVADAGSVNQAQGTFTITIANSKVGSPTAGQTLGNISPRSFAGNGNVNVTGSTAADITSVTPSYVLVGNGFCRPRRPPTAALAASPIEGNAPLAVSFDGSGSSDPDGDAIVSYTFDFGDGSSVVTQTTPTISHTYNGVGSYRATLEVRDATGQTSINVAQAFITVNDRPPTAALTGTPTSGNAPLAVSFDGSGSSDPDPGDSVTSYTFDFGEGGVITQSTPTVSHTYNQAGTYTAKLTVQDSHGAASTNTAQVSIRVNTPPTVSITSPTEGATFSAPANITITANASDSDGTVSKVEFFQNNIKIGEDLTAPYSFAWSNVPSGTYTLTAVARDNDGAATTSASVYIVVNDPPVCLEDNDSRIAYSNGWHLVNDPNASAGHFTFNTGKSTNGMKLAFDVPAGRTGAVTYAYAKAPKGGSAEVFIDGVSRGTISYNGTKGTTRAPEFGYNARYTGLAPGQHTFELRNVRDAVYVDGICLDNSYSNARPATGPGVTQTNTTTLSAAQELVSSVTLGADAREIAVVAESTAGAPIKLVLIDPSGLVLNTADASTGYAVIETPVTQGGVYIIKVVNISLGPIEVWTAATPLVAR